MTMTHPVMIMTTWRMRQAQPRWGGVVVCLFIAGGNRGLGVYLSDYGDVEQEAGAAKVGWLGGLPVDLSRQLKVGCVLLG